MITIKIYENFLNISSFYSFYMRESIYENYWNFFITFWVSWMYSICTNNLKLQ